MKTILLFNGKKRSGKDHLVDIFINDVSKKYTKKAFATKLKKICSDMINVTVNQFDDLKNRDKTIIINRTYFINNWRSELLKLYDKDNELSKYTLKEIKTRTVTYNLFKNLTILSTNDNEIELSVRSIIQYVGESFKDIFENRYIWAELLAKILDKEDKNFIISDYRYPEELEVFNDYLDNHFVYTVKVIGKNYHNSTDTHISEIALDDADFHFYINNTIYNKKSIKAQLKALHKEVKDN